MRTPYRFKKEKKRKYYQVMFEHIPQKWFSTGADTLTGAVMYAENKMQEVTGLKKDITLSEFAKDFFKQSDPKGYRHRLDRRNTQFDESYFSGHQSRLDNYILKAHGCFLLSSIKDTLIEDFILDIPKIANATKNKILDCYRIVLKEAVRQGYIEHNPADDVKQLPTLSKERSDFTDEEMLLLFPADDDELIKVWGSFTQKDGLKWAVYFLIQRDTGFRPGEVAGLSKLNYFPEFRGIYTTADVSWRTHRLTDHIKTTKKGQKYKTGLLTEQTARLLQFLIINTKSEYLFEISHKNGISHFIYCELANKRLRAVCSKLGIDIRDRTQYSFRHTFNTSAIGNIPEQARLLLMGHTKDRPEYNHLTPQKALERVQKLLEK